ncbi:MAG TPA: aminotransferase class IV [Cyclobacteriaceae bacterium]|jgi:4-amino-4-deoxychorismate lyase|nr:aminotransferase class IV [Cyclobacteriaceae bacterium]
MSRFIETIRLKDGVVSNLDYHVERMNRSVDEVLRTKQKFDLEDALSSLSLPPKGLHKIRLIYDAEIRSIEVTPYKRKEIRQLKIVYDNAISYDYKFENRAELESLFNQRDDGDDVIIIKNYQVTDTSYANLVFKKNNQWFTPKTFLLNGTTRKRLLEEKIIFEEKITINDLPRYEKVKLINAMLQFDGPEIDVSQIVS